MQPVVLSINCLPRGGHGEQGPQQQAGPHPPGQHDGPQPRGIGGQVDGGALGVEPGGKIVAAGHDAGQVGRP